MSDEWGLGSLLMTHHSSLITQDLGWEQERVAAGGLGVEGSEEGGVALLGRRLGRVGWQGAGLCERGAVADEQELGPRPRDGDVHPPPVRVQRPNAALRVAGNQADGDQGPLA